MSKPRILVVGSTNMDFVVCSDRVPEAGETIMSNGSYFTAPGGKGANGAVAAARLGADVILCARVGKDVYGRTLLDMYKAEGMDVRFVSEDEKEPTGLAQIFREANGQNRITVFTGSNINMGLADVEDAFTCYPDALLTQCEIPVEVMRYAVKSANKQNIPVFLDMAPVRDDLDFSKIGKCEIISPNETEAAFYTGIAPVGDDCLKAAIELYKRVKTKYVVLKLGDRGCFVYDGYHSEYVPSMNVTAVDTTGAGDCFTAALTVRYLANGKDILDAARFANCAGAFSVTKSGAFASFPHLAELDAFVRAYNAQ